VVITRDTLAQETPSSLTFIHHFISEEAFSPKKFTLNGSLTLEEIKHGLDLALLLMIFCNLLLCIFSS